MTQQSLLEKLEQKFRKIDQRTLTPEQQEIYDQYQTLQAAAAEAKQQYEAAKAMKS